MSMLSVSLQLVQILLLCLDTSAATLAIKICEKYFQSPKKNASRIIYVELEQDVDMLSRETVIALDIRSRARSTGDETYGGVN